MNAEVARDLARDVHAGQLSRSGEPFFAHVERVAGAVPDHARALAYLHDVLERSDTRFQDLRRLGLTSSEYAVLKLLSRSADDSYESYIARIASARGTTGQLARLIKLADLDDHLQHRSEGPAPDYASARRRIARRRPRAARRSQPIPAVAG